MPPMGRISDAGPLDGPGFCHELDSAFTAADPLPPAGVVGLRLSLARVLPRILVLVGVVDRVVACAAETAEPLLEAAEPLLWPVTALLGPVPLDTALSRSLWLALAAALTRGVALARNRSPCSPTARELTMSAIPSAPVAASRCARLLRGPRSEIGARLPEIGARLLPPPNCPKRGEGAGAEGVTEGEVTGEVSVSRQ